MLLIPKKTKHFILLHFLSCIENDTLLHSLSHIVYMLSYFSTSLLKNQDILYSYNTYSTLSHSHIFHTRSLNFSTTLLKYQSRQFIHSLDISPKKNIPQRLVLTKLPLPVTKKKSRFLELRYDDMTIMPLVYKLLVRSQKGNRRKRNNPRQTRRTLVLAFPENTISATYRPAKVTATRHRNRMRPRCRNPSNPTAS